MTRIAPITCITRCSPLEHTGIAIRYPFVLPEVGAARDEHEHYGTQQAKQRNMKDRHSATLSSLPSSGHTHGVTIDLRS